MNIKEDIKSQIYQYFIRNTTSKQEYTHLNSNITIALLYQYCLTVVHSFKKQTKGESDNCFFESLEVLKILF